LAWRESAWLAQKRKPTQAEEPDMPPAQGPVFALHDAGGPEVRLVRAHRVVLGIRHSFRRSTLRQAAFRVVIYSSCLSRLKILLRSFWRMRASRDSTALGVAASRAARSL